MPKIVLPTQWAKSPKRLFFYPLGRVNVIIILPILERPKSLYFSLDVIGSEWTQQISIQIYLMTIITIDAEKQTQNNYELL